MRPCQVCGNREKKQLNSHHLIPKMYRKIGTPQKTMKMCRDRKGCQVHLKFHLGSRKAARRIRAHMWTGQYRWLLAVMGQEWVEQVYPKE